MLDPSRIVLSDPQFKANPYLIYAQLRAEAPVCRVSGKPRPIWLVTRYDDVLAVLRDERLVNSRAKAPTPDAGFLERLIFSVYGLLLQNVLTSDGPDHARLRRLLQKAFNPRRVESLRDRTQVLTNELLDRLARRPQWDIVADYALPLSATIISEILGVPVRDRERFQRWVRPLTGFGTGITSILKMTPGFRAAIRYIRSLIKLRRMEPQDDLISALVAEKETGDLHTEDELVAMILSLSIGGYDTTTNLIGSGTLALLENPLQMEKLRAQPHLIPLAVEEFARYYSPSDYASMRWTRCDVTVGNVEIPKGEPVMAALISVNRDEAQFDHPEALDVARDPNRHVTFGPGIHHCVGVFLARMEAQIAFATLIERTSELRLAVPRRQLRLRRSLMLRGLESLPVEGPVST
jgi:cytochrome P450